MKKKPDQQYNCVFKVLSSIPDKCENFFINFYIFNQNSVKNCSKLKSKETFEKYNASTFKKCPYFSKSGDFTETKVTSFWTPCMALDLHVKNSQFIYQK